MKIHKDCYRTIAYVWLICLTLLFLTWWFVGKVLFVSIPLTAVPVSYTHLTLPTNPAV